MQLPPAQYCCAKQAGSRLVPLQIHLWKFAPHSGLHWPSTTAVPHCFWQSGIATCSVLLCKTGWQQACATANIPVEVCSSFRSAVAQHQGSATLLLAKCNCPLLSTAVHKRLAAGLCHSKYTYGESLLIQVCSGPAPVQCHIAFGKMQLSFAQYSCAKQAGSRLVPLQIHLWRVAPETGLQWPCTRAVPHCIWQNAIVLCSVQLCKTGWQQACATANTPVDCSSFRSAVAQHQGSATLLLAKWNCPLLSTAVQNRLAAGLCHCRYTCGSVLLIQVCSGAAPIG